MKRHSKRTVYIPPGVLLLLAVGSTQAATLYVPSQYATVTAAMNAASDLDTIVLAPGTYTGVFTFNKSVLIQGAGSGATVLSANNTGPTVTVTTAKSVTLADLTVRDGKAPSQFPYGGGIFNQGNLTAFRCVVTANSADTAGGGISNIGGTMAMYDTSVTANATSYGGGGVDNESALYMERCTVSGNTVDAAGGGILNTGDIQMLNCTVAANTSQQGGGIYNAFGSVDLTNCTVASNTVSVSGGGVVNLDTFSAANSIFASNTAPTDVDFAGALVSNDYNLIQNTSGAAITGTTAHNKLSVSPNLGALGNSGGYTLVLPLQSPSAAIDGGPSAAGSYPALDQRGGARPAGSASDIGAFEYNATGALDRNNVYVDKAWVTPELGTQANPFNTVQEGVTAVNSGGNVFIKAATYPEIIDTNKPMDLRLNGTGAVIIGQ